MNRYPHTRPCAPVFGFAAIVATVLTLGVAIVLPAHLSVQPGVDNSVLATRGAAPAEVTVKIERVEAVAVRPAPAVDKATPVPAAFVATKQRG